MEWIYRLSVHRPASVLFRIPVIETVGTFFNRSVVASSVTALDSPDREIITTRSSDSARLASGFTIFHVNLPLDSTIYIWGDDAVCEVATIEQVTEQVKKLLDLDPTPSAMIVSFSEEEML